MGDSSAKSGGTRLSRLEEWDAGKSDTRGAMYELPRTIWPTRSATVSCTYSDLSMETPNQYLK